MHLSKRHRPGRHRGDNTGVKLALLSDLHANLQALNACLADARERGVTHHAFLGDLVGYGADPAPVMETVMTLAEKGAWVIRGNHDEAAAMPPADDLHRADNALGSWTHEQLRPEQRDFILGLPLTVQHGRMMLVHASAHAPRSWTYVVHPNDACESLDAAREMGASLVFCGHVHEQRLFYRDAGADPVDYEPAPGMAILMQMHREWLAAIGSVGQPRDGDPRAMYAIYDEADEELTFLRIPYDYKAAARAIRRAGLPERNAVRLGLGR